jgi:hypothetical protein
MCTHRHVRAVAADSTSGVARLTCVRILLACSLPTLVACGAPTNGGASEGPPVAAEASLQAIDDTAETGQAPATLSIESDLFHEVDLATGQTVALKNTGLRVLLVEARGPRSDCKDCPNKATLQATLDGESKELGFTLSGNMPLSVMERARRREAHGYVFFMIRIVDNNVRFRIEPAVPEGKE